MRRIAVGLSCVVLSACFIPVDAGTDRSCIVGSDQTCSESLSMSALAGTCRSDGTCLCNSGFSLSTTSGRCVASGVGGGSAGGSGTGGGAAQSGSPNVMLLLDVSGSMNAPVNLAQPTCGTCSGATCPVTCPTRISMFRVAFAQFFQANPSAARFGVTTFPANTPTFSPTGCAPAEQQAISLPGTSVTDAPAALAAQTQLVSAFVQGIGSATPVTGGTPTASSLRFLATIPAMTNAGRPRGVILVTDGLPNCNPNNALGCDLMPPSPAALCTLGANCVGQYCRAGYLDQTETVQAVAALRSAGIRTAVVLVGENGAPQTVPVMNAMADEGGATACTAGPGCTVRYFDAPDTASLTAALNAALARVSQ